MRYASMWKRIKRKLNKRRKLFLAINLTITTSIIITSIQLLTETKRIYAENIEFSQLGQEVDELSNWLSEGESIRAILHKVYVCGEEIQQLDELSYEEVVTLAEQNPDWELTADQSYTMIRFVEHIEDLSPYCKKNAFFGINDEGVFSLFDGEPSQDKVIKTFFQLNVPYLESSLPDQEIEHLLIGIRVKDLEEYDSVLSTYSEYSMERFQQEEKVMSDNIK